MRAEFNAYHQWLGVPAEIQAPNHYELLGLRWGEDSTELIQSAAEQRCRCLEPRMSGEHGWLARRILSEIAEARRCLLDRHAKDNYDRQLGPDLSATAQERPLPPCAAQPPTGGAAAAPAAASEPGEPGEESPARTARGANDGSRSASAAEQPSRGRIARRGRVPAGSAQPTSGPAEALLQPVTDGLGLPRVPIVGKLALDSILEELGHAMQQCRQLYLASVPPSQGFATTVLRQSARNHDLLHRGLLAKIYATIAEADGRWTYEEQRCAAGLLQHLGVKCSPDDLEQTARKLIRQAQNLHWQRLLQPFQEVPELQAHRAELQTAVMRVANLIAKADGRVASKEAAALRDIQEMFHAERPPEAVEELPPLAPEPAATEPIQAPWEAAGQQRRPKRAKVDRAQQREQCLQQLAALVGLRQVKQELAELADWVLFQSQRRQAELPHEILDLQFVFVGPSGTGKTLVARLLSELLFASGGLQHGQLVEASGFDLASRDARDAAKSMKAIVARAIGGTLLINDAGALLLAGNASAAKALSVLRKNLAAHTGRLAVVLAADHADRLLPLLDQHAEFSRLFRRRWQFADYAASELGRIFQACCDRSRYQVTRLAQIKVLLGIHWSVRQDRQRFGNGHGVQRVFARAVQHLARRIAGMSPLTKELLTTFHDSDIAIEGVPAAALADLADPRRLFAITCPGCATVHLVGKDLLGVHVKCKSCQHQFVCAWGEPVDLDVDV